MRALRVIVVATVIVQGCVGGDPELTASHGVRQDVIDAYGVSERRKSDSPRLVELVVDAHDLGVRKELEEATADALRQCKSVALVSGNSDFVLRIVASGSQASGFERQEPLRLAMLVVATSDDDHSDFRRLERESVMQGNFRCLRLQAPEMCRMFVTYLETVTRMASTMHEDSR